MNIDIDELEGQEELDSGLLAEEQEAYYGVALDEKMPLLVREWTKAALGVSENNVIPAQMAFFTLLGQIVKEHVVIPTGPTSEDSRVHFCWIQTSGTGKSTLWNFLGPVSKSLFKKINANDGLAKPEAGEEHADPRYTIFDITEYTDAALIGGYDSYIDDGEPAHRRAPGALEGSGLAHWDEFEYSGVFKQSQHKENIIVYLNTLMNSLGGESWVITKKLRGEGPDVMECQCKRSVFATTYPPKRLESVITDKGVLQRMLVYVRHVPEHELKTMRRKQIKKAGTQTDISISTDRFVNALFRIYTDVKKQCYANGGFPKNTMQYSAGYQDALTLELVKMEKLLETYPPHIQEIGNNFVMRWMNTLQTLAVLCCIANSPNVKNENMKFTVTPTHVRQAYNLTQQCFNTLMEWLDSKLKAPKVSLDRLAKEKSVLQVLDGMEKDPQGYVLKNDLLKALVAKGIKQTTAYRYYNKIKHHLDIDGKKIKAKERNE